jgi:ATP-dependent DNA helicase DinG
VIDRVTGGVGSPAAAAQAAGEVALRERQGQLRAAFAPGGALARGLPGFVARPSQLEMAEAVLEAIATRGTLVAEAGTGTGKTLAYLVPALLAGGRVLVSVASRALQDQLVARDIPAAVKALGIDLDVALLKGRQNYVCRLRLERTEQAGWLASPEEARDLQRVVRFARTSSDGDRGALAAVPEQASIWPAVTSTRDNCTGSECPHFEDCFVMQARRRALAADLLVVNHHLLLADIALRESATAELLPRADVVVIDEAHHLARVAGDFFGETWSIHQVVEFSGDLQRIGRVAAPDGADWSALSQSLVGAGRGLRAAFAQAGASPGARLDFDRVAEQAVLAAALETLRAALADSTGALQANSGREAELDALATRGAGLYKAVGTWAGAAAGEAGPAHAADISVADHVRWVSLGTHGAQFHDTPLDCADTLARARLQREQAWVLTSATLTAGGRFDAFLREAGLEGARALAWESPFDFPRQGLLYLPEDLPDPRNGDFAEAVAQAVWPVAQASHGRAFVLCSTLRAVDRIGRWLRERVQAEASPLEILVQGEQPRGALLEAFRKSGQAILVGAASFWEGIDVRGDALSLVAIDKLPFAPPDDPVVAAQIRRLKAAGGDPFRQFQLPRAITQLRQGAGRLIRGDADRGVLMILDDRLMRQGYGRTILASLPPFTRTRQLQDAVGFFQADPAVQDAGPSSRVAG